MRVTGRATKHKPELILNGFSTRLGLRVSRAFTALFPQVCMTRAHIRSNINTGKHTRHARAAAHTHARPICPVRTKLISNHVKTLSGLDVGNFLRRYLRAFANRHTHTTQYLHRICTKSCSHSCCSCFGLYLLPLASFIAFCLSWSRLIFTHTHIHTHTLGTRTGPGVHGAKGGDISLPTRLCLRTATQALTLLALPLLS